MRWTVLFAVVLVLNSGGCDGPTALAGTDSTAAPQSTGPQSATQEDHTRTSKDFPQRQPPMN